MSTSTTVPRVTGVEIRDADLILELEDGTSARAPLDTFPVLSSGTSEERSSWRIIHGGRAVRWPLLDEDISVFSLLHPERCIPMRPEAVARHLQKVRRWRAERDGARSRDEADTPDQGSQTP